tara:strand:+ start:218 stop:427 length:210 start_codon:yes stop_codon:yes gene_type:complete
MINNPAIMLYKQIDGNLGSIKQEAKKPTMGLLSSNKTSSNKKYDENQPIVRAMKHMEVIRNQREELKNG